MSSVTANGVPLGSGIVNTKVMLYIALGLNEEKRVVE